MTDVTGASVPDQALVSDGAPADRHPSGFDPSRVEAVMVAMQRYAVAYSHNTYMDMSTRDQTWNVYEVGEDNPFLRPEPAWIGMFDNKREANAVCLRLNAENVLAVLRDSDRNPEGEDAQRLSAEHESAGRNGIAQTPVGESAQ